MSGATSSNSGQEWTDDKVHQLRTLAEGNTPVGVMNIKTVSRAAVY
ncbi:hypothetical protein [Kribbella shirazensis]|uniref:Uncharacterized protein n=1 Tax=Kribbella shirazensis TaxID=1105143 RepID=A0A7X5V5Z8_9ACTN|nr:hypothetical protein [Kribbella shirazensis]NIK55243.1 hypothetical protein [Kribbella shirazensis]